MNNLEWQLVCFYFVYSSVTSVGYGVFKPRRLHACYSNSNLLQLVHFTSSDHRFTCQLLQVTSTPLHQRSGWVDASLDWESKSHQCPTLFTPQLCQDHLTICPPWPELNSIDWPLHAFCRYSVFSCLQLRCRSLGQSFIKSPTLYLQLHT